MGETDSAATQMQADVKRYRWLCAKFVEGKETYIGEFIISKQDLDEYIGSEMEKEA